MLNYLKTKLFNYLTSKLLPITNVSNRITLDKQLRLYENGSLISNQLLKNLQEEIKFLEESNIWKYLNGNPEMECQKLVFKHSQTLTDLVIGKAILYTLDVQKNILKNIKRARSA